MTNLETFIREYQKQLEKAVVLYPGEYGYGPENVPVVTGRLASALRENRPFIKDSRAVVATCQALGIPNTYAAIKAFISSPPVVKKDRITTRIINRLFKTKPQNLQFN